ncbi:MAG: hypothetical protein L6R43_14040, partial [Planctomycetes bacterium]|nr:hypothetical protein [Planctomycetota bacterium]
LVFLCAVRSVLDLCLDAGVAQFGTCAVGRASCDAGGAVAVFPLEVEVEAAPETVQALLQAFSTAQRQGLGLRRVEIDGRGGGGAGRGASSRLRSRDTKKKDPKDLEAERERLRQLDYRDADAAEDRGSL